MTYDFFMNLLIGIVGGIYSSIIVSRVFLLGEELDKQMNILRGKYYYFGELIAFFDITEAIMKLQSDTSDEIEREIRRDPEYLKSNDIIRASDVHKAMKKEILDKTVERMFHEENPSIMKRGEFIELVNKTNHVIQKYKRIAKFKFKTIEDSKKEIEDLRKEYEMCFSKRNKYFLSQIIKDKIMIGLCLLFIVLCVLVFLMN